MHFCSYFLKCVIISAPAAVMVSHGPPIDSNRHTNTYKSALHLYVIAVV